MTREDRRYHRVSPRFWADTIDWTDDERLAALYALTGPHRRTEGLYRLPPAYAAEDLGMNARRFEAAWRGLERHGFIEFDPSARVVLVVKALAYQAPENQNQTKAAIKHLLELPDTPLLGRLYDQAERYCERLREALTQAFPHLARNPSPTVPGTVGATLPPTVPERDTRPSSSSSSSTSPLSPPKGGDDVVPRRPAGNRKTDLDAWAEHMATFTARNFPGADPERVSTAASFIRRNGSPVKADDLRRLAANDEIWAGELGLAHGGAAA